MDLERAKEITAQCVANCMVYVLGGEFKPLPDCSLEEMLEANRAVREESDRKSAAAQPDENGKRTFSVDVTVDPRLLAASYAFEQYGRNPIDLLGALGIEATPTEPDEDDEENAAACG